MKAVPMLLMAAAHESAGARKASLVLHGLGAEDRRWVLAHLPSPQLDTVRRLLDELAVLGLPADSGVVEELLGSHQTAAALSGQEPFALAQAAAQDLVQVVRSERADLVATLLNVRAWPWQNEFLGLLPLPRRRQVEESLDRLRRSQQAPGRMKANALEAALVHEIAARVESLPQRVKPGRAGIPALVQKVRRVLGGARSAVVERVPS